MRDPIKTRDHVLAARVAERFAAGSRPLKPEKLQALLLKLRKGAGTSLKIKDLVPVFDYLGGWKFEETRILLPEGDSATDTMAYTHPHPGNVQTTWEQAKNNEVRQLPDPERLKLHQTIYQDVSDLETLPSGQKRFTYRAWQVSPGTRVNPPAGKSLELTMGINALLEAYATNLWGVEEGSSARKKFSDWLNKETPFLRQINEKLGMESLEAEKERKHNEKHRTTENMGTCPCCFGHFKLTPRARHGRDKSVPGMVLHGYKRPGTGYVQGNCFGQDWPPFELSSEGTEAFIVRLELTVKNLEETVDRLKSGRVTSLLDERSKKTIEPGDPHWDRILKHQIETTEAQIHSVEVPLKVCKKHLTQWKPQELPWVGDALKSPI